MKLGHRLNTMKIALNLIISIVFVFSSLSFADTNIIVVGDFGTGDKKDKYIIGNNDSGQKIVADAIKKYCDSQSNAPDKCRFLVSTGDNFYDHGVEDKYMKDLDSFFKERFLSYYGHFKDKGVLFFMSLGNHDIGDLGWGSTAQKLYTKEITRLKNAAKLLDNQISIHNNSEINPKIILSGDLFKKTDLPFFYLPEPFYHVDLLKKDINMFAINTMSYPAQHFSKEVLQKDEIATFEMEDFKETSPEEKEEKEEKPSQEVLKVLENYKNNIQEEKLREAMNKDAKWKIVFGHFPIISHGKHGKEILNVVSSSSTKNLREVLCDTKVDFYFTGHDHHMELSTYRCDNGHTVTEILSGAGGKLDRIYWSTLYRKSRLWSMHEDTNGKPAYFHWGNGRYYQKLEDAEQFRAEKAVYVLGFSSVHLRDDGSAEIKMHTPYAAATNEKTKKLEVLKDDALERKTACFKLEKATKFDLKRCDTQNSVLYEKNK
jgi:hypothetical protein